MTLFRVRNLLFAAPLLTVVTAWALPSAHVEATAPAATDVTTSVTTNAATSVTPDNVTDEVATDDAAEVTTDVGADVGVDGFVVNNCTYYNNASHSQVVGQFGYDCCNNPVAWGRKTTFSDCGGCFPCIPPPR